MKTRDFAEVIRARMRTDLELAAGVERALREDAVRMDNYFILLAQLKPCPHCGGVVGFDDDPWGSWKRGVGFSIDCPSCYLRMNAFAKETLDSLIERWNQRK